MCEFNAVTTTEDVAVWATIKILQDSSLACMVGQMQLPEQSPQISNKAEMKP